MDAPPAEFLADQLFRLLHRPWEDQLVGFQPTDCLLQFFQFFLQFPFPVTTAAIKREGRVLDHCVGGYADRHMKGVTTILFLRFFPRILAERKGAAPNA